MKKLFTIITLAFAFFLSIFSSAVAEEVTFTTTTLGAEKQIKGYVDGGPMASAEFSFEFTLDEALFAGNDYAVTEASNGSQSYNGITSVTLERIVFNQIWVGDIDYVSSGAIYHGDTILGNAKFDLTTGPVPRALTVEFSNSDSQKVSLNLKDTYRVVFETYGVPEMYVAPAGEVDGVVPMKITGGFTNGHNNGYQIADVSIVTSATYDSSASSPPGTIPEPTTATLSLLALAGLAARRRRR